LKALECIATIQKYALEAKQIIADSKTLLEDTNMMDAIVVKELHGDNIHISTKWIDL
jgi:hypothetical protein